MAPHPLARAAALVVALGGCGAHGGQEAAARDDGAAVAPVASCANPDTATPVQVVRDVAYVERDGRTLRYDLARPRTAGPRPLVVLLHGGGWEGGSRASMHDEMLALARQGYVAASVEYRLTRAGSNVFPAAIADARCAVRVLRARAGEHGIDPARIAVAGYSAGAHLASMLGAAADVPGLDAPCDGTGDARVQAVVSYAGPQDLRVRGAYTEEQARLVTNFLGVFPGDAPEVARLASPVAHASADDAPFLLVQGKRDRLVPPEHAPLMASALRRAGAKATVLPLARVAHGFVGLATSRRAGVRCTTLAFLARWVGEGQGD